MAREMVIILRVDDSDHSCLAMFCLRAIEPMRLCVGDGDCECWHHCCVGGDGHKAGEESSHVWLDIVDGYTWICKGRFNNRVVLIKSGLACFVGICRGLQCSSLPLDRTDIGPCLPGWLGSHLV